MAALDIARSAPELAQKRRLRKRDPRRIAAAAGAIALKSGGRAYRKTLTANVAANMVRNVWAYAIIFCGHFPDQTYTFSQEEVEDESRGGWYVRQLVGAANIDGSPLFHVASGNLGYQVEHHLFPDMPSTRYAEIAPRVKEICERYELPYNTGPFMQAARHGAADDPAPRVPRRQAAPEAGPLQGRRRRTTSRRVRSACARRGRPAPNGSGPEQPDEGVRFSMPDR